MKQIFDSKPLINKRTKQISITIPKKKLHIFRNRNPKRVRVSIDKIEW